jgi:hypothetical protein
MKKSVTGGMIALCIAALATCFTACKKEEETIATIIIKNELGQVVPGATVRLYGQGSVDDDFIGEIRFDTTAVTNGTGKVSFNFSEFYKQGQAGFVVLDIEATKGALFGDGIIKVEEETTTEEVVILE